MAKEQTGTLGYHADAGMNTRSREHALSGYETIIRNAKTMSAADFRKYFSEVRKILLEQSANNYGSGSTDTHDAYIIRAFDELEKQDKEYSGHDAHTSDFHKNVVLLANYVHNMNLEKNPKVAERAMSDKYKSGQARLERKIENDMILMQAMKNANTNS